MRGAYSSGEQTLIRALRGHLQGVVKGPLFLEATRERSPRIYSAPEPGTLGKGGQCMQKEGCSPGLKVF